MTKECINEMLTNMTAVVDVIDVAVVDTVNIFVVVVLVRWSADIAVGE